MSKQQQIEKNLMLSEKFADYMVEHPELLQKFPRSASYVTFSLNDKELNKLNSKLIDGLLKEGKNVIKVVETNDKENPWNFTTVTL